MIFHYLGKQFNTNEMSRHAKLVYVKMFDHKLTRLYTFHPEKKELIAQLEKIVCALRDTNLIKQAIAVQTPIDEIDGDEIEI